MYRTLLILIVVCLPILTGVAADDALIGHWPLTEHARDVSGNELHAENVNVRFVEQAAAFDGVSSVLKISEHAMPDISASDFSMSMWVNADSSGNDVPGDLVSQYDADTNIGFHVGLKTNAGVTFTQANTRQLQFGIDHNVAPTKWTDRGRPGNALLAFGLCTFDGDLYAGTCEPSRDEAGHVYRLEDDDRWIDCGAPDDSNAVTAMAEFDGRLYAGTGKYRLRGSSLTESENTHAGGRVFHYEGGTQWTEVGRLGESEAVGGMVVYRNQLYASSLYRPAGFFRFDGDAKWTELPSPERPRGSPGDTTHMRVEAMGVYNGWLFATSYDGGRVFRFDGTEWQDCGQLADNTQTYAFAVLAGRLYVGTWRSGRVYRFEAPHQWTDVGRLGEELEVMGMLAHNGRLVAGTLPLAEVYEFDGQQSWNRLTRLDHTPNVTYRRAWTMAEFDGQVFCSTLPSGHVYSWQAGHSVTADRAFPVGWHHVAAVRSGDTLRLFIDGKMAAEQTHSDIAGLGLKSNQPLHIGFGPNDYFKGQLSDVRLHGRTLSDSEIAKLAASR